LDGISQSSPVASVKADKRVLDSIIFFTTICNLPAEIFIIIFYELREMQPPGTPEAAKLINF